MQLRIASTLSAFALSMLVLLACGGKTVFEGGGNCVTVDLATYDQSCVTASDCATITAGQICAGECACGGAAINQSGLARYEATLSQVALAHCFCPASPTPQCVAGTCTVCSGPNPPPGCPTPPPPPPDAGRCVDIDLATYDRTCQQDGDCIQITAGELCPTSCLCGGTTVNAREATRYAAAISGLQAEECPCANLGPPRCVYGTCTICAIFTQAAPGCPDGG